MFIHTQIHLSINNTGYRTGSDKKIIGTIMYALLWLQLPNIIMSLIMAVLCGHSSIVVGGSFSKRLTKPF